MCSVSCAPKVQAPVEIVKFHRCPAPPPPKYVKIDRDASPEVIFEAVATNGALMRKDVNDLRSTVHCYDVQFDEMEKVQ